ncbi:hypothetical protein [Sinorhizobium alkalisoli]|uniref:Uncharacterized protein n=1 Tax=Sinorhizobium alkalisoli TaxID=1752398 RepID=A0A1E3VFF6_9HYPH|nr:hypothetical protein [Sinorhizobium alkalisoli]ODR92322.1 hypothetical protein A8M32_05765 [Sinorhizobium alkalisoli]QFI70734.1 hypothetical protein EKH55_5860 [Sinorhizobium alkalisoli]
MRLTPAANSDAPDFGVSVAEDGDTVTLSFDLERIAAFRSTFGDDVFVEVAVRYVEERAVALSAHDELWLWKEAVLAHVY